MQNTARAVERQTETPAQTRVIYQGQPGAYAEEAAKAYFGADCVRTNAKSWEGVLIAIREGLGDYGVLPIENSSTGSISAVYDLLGQYGMRHCGRADHPGGTRADGAKRCKPRQYLSGLFP